MNPFDVAVRAVFWCLYAAWWAIVFAAPAEIRGEVIAGNIFISVAVYAAFRLLQAD